MYWLALASPSLENLLLITCRFELLTVPCPYR